MNEVKTLMSGSLPNSSGTAAAAAAADSSTRNDVSSSLNRPDPSDVSDYVVTTTDPLDEEVARSSPTPFDDLEDMVQLQSPCRQLFAADDSSTHNDEPLTPQDRPQDDLPDDDVFTTTPLDDDGRVKRCEEGCSSPASPDTDNAVVSEEDLSPAHIGGNDEDTFDKSSLPEDTFSFLIYSKVQSGPFSCAIIVFLLQIAIYAIIAVNIIDSSNEKNPVSFPPDVDVPVRISEALAIAIAIMTQDDVRKALVLLREQFYQEGLPPDKNDLPQAFQGATMAKWILSIILRATEGLLGLSITFLLIMRSSTVLDLLLNFLAIEFVTLLDDVVFSLAKEGFLGAVLKKEAKNLSDTAYFVNHQSSKAAPYYTFAYFFVLPLIMFAGWGIIRRHQSSGKYLCGVVLVQFSDELLPALGTFSGLYLSQRMLSFGNRLSYVPKDDRDGGPLLAYCEEEKRWTLSLTKDDSSNPCEDWYAASSESADFDVLTTASSQWYVNTAQNRAVPLAQNFLACYDCTDNLCGSNGKCNDKGECECEPGHNGLRCEYPEHCQTLEIDPRDEGFLKEGGGSFASKYYRLEGAEAYNHPIYTSLRDNQTLGDETDIILFTGVRWILSYKHLFPGLRDVNDVSGLAAYFHTQFHGYFTNYSASYVSDPVYIDTQVDATASPLSVRWRHSALDNGQRLRPDVQKDFIEASFFCAVCNNNTNPCQFGAMCQLNGTCGDCPNGSSGTMCQIPPTSNGQCNPYFNNINFGFDGGDCCDNTCRSTPENTCGKAGQGYIDTGYPSCASASNQWELSGDPIYGVNSASRSGLAVALSGKGTILAVADPGVSIVRLFDKEGSNWIERDQVQGPPESNFGLAIDLSDESYNITRNPSTSSTVTLAVGALGLVRIFTCSTIGCIQRGEDIIGSEEFGNSLSIAKDGSSIAIGGADVAYGGVKVFTWSDNTWQLKENATIAAPLSRKLGKAYFILQGYYVSLSGDYLAVGTLEGTSSSISRFPAGLITQVYKWGESTGWAQLGDEIEKEFFAVDASFRAPWPLKSVVIKGHTLAICSNSSVAVYEWNEASSEWTPREIELESSEVDGLLGWSVDLSEDANILAVGTHVENPQPTDESVRMYKWDGKRYTVQSNGVPAGAAASLSLSSDGAAVAVGLPFDSWKGGSTRVYSYHPSSPCEDPSELPLRISFTTDSNPEETSWELQVDSQVKRSSGSLSGYTDTTFVEEMCIPAISCVKFIVYDTEGDGLNPPGVFSLMFNGKEEARGGDFEFYGVTSFGDCECPEDKVPFTLNVWSNFADTEWSLFQQNTLLHYKSWKSIRTLSVDECIPRGCYDLSSFDNVEGVVPGNEIIYDATYDGESIVSLKIFFSDWWFSPRSYKFGECSTTTTTIPEPTVSPVATTPEPTVRLTTTSPPGVVIEPAPIPTYIITESPAANVGPTSCGVTCDSVEACMDACVQIDSEWGWNSTVQSDTSMPFAGCFYKKGGKCWYGNFGSDEDQSVLFQDNTRERLCCDETATPIRQ